jgi:hypothetical protein
LNKPFKRASILYWASIPVLLLYGIIYPDKVLALNVHDTLYVIANLPLQFFFAALFFAFGLVYHLLYASKKYKPVKLLILFHILFSIAGLFILFLTPQFPTITSGDMMMVLEKSKLYQNGWMLGLFVFVGAQLLFVINLLLNIIRK